jgi:putative transposase
VATPRYRRLAGGVSTLRYHLVWCPKFRRPVLGGEVAAALAGLLRERAAALGCQVEALEVMPDHVHLVVEAPPTLAPQQIVSQCKGYTSRVLRARFPWLRRRLPSLWSRAYYAASAGHVSAATVRRYVAAQKGV